MGRHRLGSRKLRVRSSAITRGRGVRHHNAPRPSSSHAAGRQGRKVKCSASQWDKRRSAYRLGPFSLKTGANMSHTTALASELNRQME
jgi:hypothetical protein